MAFQEWPSQGHTPSLSCTSAHLNFIQQPTPSVTHWTWNRMISKTQYFHAGKVQARCQAWCRTCMHEICREPQRTSNFLWIWKCSENAWIISEDPQQRLPWDVLGRLGAFWTFWDVLHVEQVLMVLHWCSKVLPQWWVQVVKFLALEHPWTLWWVQVTTLCVLNALACVQSLTSHNHALSNSKYFNQLTHGHPTYASKTLNQTSTQTRMQAQTIFPSIFLIP